MLRTWMTAGVLALVATLPLEPEPIALTGAADAAPRATVASAWTGEAACLAPDRLNARSVEARLARLGAGEPRVDRTVAGFELKDETRPLAEALSRLVPTDAGASPDPACHTAACAAAAVFGADIGPKLLYLLARYGYNGSPLVTGGKAWEPSELDEALAAFGDLPPNLAPFDDRVRTLAHDHDAALMERSDRDPMDDQPMAASGGQIDGILIGHAWHAATPAERRASILHELAHQFIESQGASFGWPDAWRRAMDADARFAFATGQSTSVVSLYAQRSQDEDFAESATAYRYMPHLLGMRAPNRYALLREWMFDGLEYAAPDQCRPELASSEREHLAAGEGLGRGQLSH
ncbi:hypothetical protein [Phenylobacterium soli]|uniref:Uncharacterized protein n=1 Tax=Phenylobacterium soli TaxID=2170551 RepID=A0A328ANN8_9CAUL|nr:hypothetical protein [Phenylobacterium soli]RAK55921.1 hypothetical protein DJ017_16100 [Phenylobacterium soli]